MNKWTDTVISYCASAVVILALMTSNTLGSIAFGERALTAIATGVIAYFLTRGGLALFKGRLRSSAQDGRASEVRALAGELWMSLKLVAWSCVVSLAVSVGGVELGTDHIVRPATAFFVTLIAQQLAFVVFELVIATTQVPRIRFRFRAAAVIVMIGIAVVFAAKSDVTLLAQRLSVAPPFPGSVRVLFALPALLVGFLGLAFRYRAEARRGR